MTPIDYDKLQRDLCDAIETASKVTAVQGDGGASNLDFVTLRLRGALYKKVKAACDAAGVSMFKASAGTFGLGLSPKAARIGSKFLQGYSHTARVVAMARVLKNHGWEVDVHSVMD